MGAFLVALRCAVCLTALGVVLGCGGGGGGEDDPGGGEVPPVDPPVTVTIPSLPEDDGHATSAHDFASVGGLYVGDFDGGGVPGNIGVRSLVRFDLSSIPAGATIQQATFNVYEVSHEGNPFTNHGVVVAFHVDCGDAVGPEDYDGPKLPSDALIITDSPASGNRIVHVTDHVSADLAAGRTHTDFRLEFNLLDSDADAIQDYVRFEDADDTWLSGEPPRLHITYQP